jgi:CDP-diglyceride synthetase
MIAGFFVAIFSGHIYVIAIVTAIQIVSFKEVIAIANVPSKAKNLKFTKALNWYFLATTMYYLYGESVIYYFKHILLVDKVLLPFATHHRFIGFMLYLMGESLSPYCSVATSRTTHRLTVRRFCFFCGIASERPLQVPIYSVCVDTYGSLSHCRTGTFHYE